ncbi:MAG: ribosome assembly factor SBDS [Candidatus Aenigmatarchaeota archaeon]
MVSVDKAVITKVTKDHKTFEILVDPDLALKFKHGEAVSVENMLAVREIFYDSRKGERASAEDLQKFFGTLDVLKVAEYILKHGQVQLTTEQRRQLLEEKKKQIADIICKQGVDPKTKIPHPVTRIMNAMDNVHVNIDAFKPARDQVEAILIKIQEILPISVEKIEIVVKIPLQYAGKASSLIRTMASVKKEEWKADHWLALIEIPAGMQSDIYEKLNGLTSGNVEIKVLKEQR